VPCNGTGDKSVVKEVKGKKNSARVNEFPGTPQEEEKEIDPKHGGEGEDWETPEKKNKSM
jgi:hypothetical protein